MSDSTVIVEFNATDIQNLDDFHNESIMAFGFPSFYGRNLDAWIDCMNYRDEDDGMAEVNVPPGGKIIIRVTGYARMKKRAPHVAEELNELVARVNQDHLDAGNEPLLLLAYDR